MPRNCLAVTHAVEMKWEAHIYFMLNDWKVSDLCNSEEVVVHSQEFARNNWSQSEIIKGQKRGRTMEDNSYYYNQVIYNVAFQWLIVFFVQKALAFLFHFGAESHSFCWDIKGCVL